MVAKRIDLGAGMIFDSISAAKLHFDPMRTQGPLHVHLEKGQFLELRKLYEEYCRKTQYSLVSPVVAFCPTMIRKSGGYTRCIGVGFQDGSATTFSLDKALSAVAV